MSNPMPSEEREPISHESETIHGEPSQQAGEKGKVAALETSKAAAMDAWSVFQLIWQDPTSGLQEALIQLGDSRAFNTGIALCVLFVIACWMVVLKAIDFFMGLAFLFGGMFSSNLSRQLDFSAHFRIFLSAAIVVAGTIAVLWGIRQIFRATGNYSESKQYVNKGGR